MKSDKIPPNKAPPIDPSLMIDALLERLKPRLLSLLWSEATHCETNLRIDQQVPHNKRATNKRVKLDEVAYMAKTTREAIRASLNGL